MHSTDSASSGIPCTSFGAEVYIGNEVFKHSNEGGPSSVSQSSSSS